MKPAMRRVVMWPVNALRNLALVVTFGLIIAYYKFIDKNPFM